jgi:uncharacterized protein YndB with AHSA1/START domain
VKIDPAFVYETDVAADPGQCWAALTEGDVTRRYWFDRRIASRWSPGESVRFYDGDSDTVTDTGSVLECVPQRRLAYTFRHELQPDAASRPFSRVTFDLTALDDGRTRIRLVHDHLQGPDEVEEWRKGWSPILDNLRDFLNGPRPPAA